MKKKQNHFKNGKNFFVPQARAKHCRFYKILKLQDPNAIYQQLIPASQRPQQSSQVNFWIFIAHFICTLENNCVGKFLLKPNPKFCKNKQTNKLFEMPNFWSFTRFWIWQHCLKSKQFFFFCFNSNLIIHTVIF